MILLHDDVGYMRFNDPRFVYGLRDLMRFSIETLVNKYDQKKSELSLLEIGAYNGESTWIFSSIFNSIVVLEPFKNDYNESDPTAKADMKKVKENFIHLVNDKCDNVTLIEEFSHDFFKNKHIKKYDEQFQMVYIDGNHEYDAVKNDISNCKKLHPFIIAGHDISSDGVYRAIIEEFPNKQIQKFIDDSWCVIYG